MTLVFPNPSRSFDEAQNAVRFTGHEGMFEVRCFVEAGALVQSDAALRGTGTSERKCLSAFDALRTSIQDVARKAYSPRRRDLYYPDRRRLPVRLGDRYFRHRETLISRRDSLAPRGILQGSWRLW